MSRRWMLGSGTSSNSTPPVTMSFQEIIAEVESILNNPDATKADLERAKNLAESVNLHDKTTLTAKRPREVIKARKLARNRPSDTAQGNLVG